MAFKFNWPEFSLPFLEKAKSQLARALNKGEKPGNIVDTIYVQDLNLGTVPPELEILEIGELTEVKFRGIFKLTYSGDAYLILQTKVQVNPVLPAKPRTMATDHGILAAHRPLVVPLQIRISNVKLRAIATLVVDKAKGVTLSFKNDPLEHVDVGSTFDSLPSVRSHLQAEIEKQLRNVFSEDLPMMIHEYSLEAARQRAWQERERALRSSSQHSLDSNGSGSTASSSHQLGNSAGASISGASSFHLHHSYSHSTGFARQAPSTSVSHQPLQSRESNGWASGAPNNRQRSSKSWSNSSSVSDESSHRMFPDRIPEREGLGSVFTGKSFHPSASSKHGEEVCAECRRHIPGSRESDSTERAANHGSGPGYAQSESDARPRRGGGESFPSRHTNHQHHHHGASDVQSISGAFPSPRTTIYSRSHRHPPTLPADPVYSPRRHDWDDRLFGGHEGGDDPQQTLFLHASPAIVSRALDAAPSPSEGLAIASMAGSGASTPIKRPSRSSSVILSGGFGPSTSASGGFAPVSARVAQKPALVSTELARALQISAEAGPLSAASSANSLEDEYTKGDIGANATSKAGAGSGFPSENAEQTDSSSRVVSQHHADDARTPPRDSPATAAIKESSNSGGSSPTAIRIVAYRELPGSQASASATAAAADQPPASGLGAALGASTPGAFHLPNSAYPDPVGSNRTQAGESNFNGRTTSGQSTPSSRSHHHHLHYQTRNHSHQHSPHMHATAAGASMQPPSGSTARQRAKPSVDVAHRGQQLMNGGYQVGKRGSFSVPATPTAASLSAAAGMGYGFTHGSHANGGIGDSGMGAAGGSPGANFTGKMKTSGSAVLGPENTLAVHLASLATANNTLSPVTHKSGLGANTSFMNRGPASLGFSGDGVAGIASIARAGLSSEPDPTGAKGGSGSSSRGEWRANIVPVRKAVIKLAT